MYHGGMLERNRGVWKYGVGMRQVEGDKHAQEMEIK